MSEKKYNIAVFISDTNPGGTEAYLRSYIPHINRDEFNVSVVATGSELLAEEIGRLADNYYNIGTGSFPRMRKMVEGKLVKDYFAILHLPFWFLYSVIRLVLFIKKNNVDLIHSHGIHFNIVSGLACKITGIPAICHVHAPPKLKRFWSGWFFYGYLSSLLATKFISVSEFAASKFHTSWKKKVAIIPNSVDLGYISTNKKNGDLRKLAGISDNEFIVGNVSVVEHRKGLERFFELAKLSQKEGRPFKFILIAGVFTEVSAEILSELMAVYSNLSNVFVIKNLKEAMLYLGDLDLFFMCSRPNTETFGLVVIEAMACGTPAIAFKNDAMPEIINDCEDGFLLQDNDILGVLECVSNIYNDKTLFENIKKNCITTVSNRFNVQSMCVDIENLYKQYL